MTHSPIPSPSDGWITLPGPDGVTVHVRAQRQGPVTRITDLYLHSADGLTPASTRCVSISRLEAELNLMSLPVRVSATDVPTLSAIYAAAGDDVAEPSLAQLRARKPTVKPAGQRSPLTRPQRDPDRFYPLVALAYSEYAAQTFAPAKAIAIEARVPVTTAQRWIAETRRRGFLPPARKGKAG